MFYEKVFEALAQNGVKYAVAGGLAVNLHGVPRMTADIDLLVDLEANNLKKFLEAMEKLGFRPRLPVMATELLDESKRRQWILDKNLHAFTFWNQTRPSEEVDLLLTASEDPAIIRRANTIAAGNLQIKIVSIDDLIAMKSKINRLQDQADIAALNQIKEMRK